MTSEYSPPHRLDAEEASAIVETMAASVEATEARIFGSFIADPKNAHDIDVMIVSDRFHGVPGHKRQHLLHPQPGDQPFDLFLLSGIEFRARREAPIVEAATSEDSLVIV